VSDNYKGRILQFPAFKDECTDYSHCTIDDYYPGGIPEDSYIDPLWTPSTNKCGGGDNIIIQGDCSNDPNMPTIINGGIIQPGDDNFDPYYDPSVSSGGYYSVLGGTVNPSIFGGSRRDGSGPVYASQVAQVNEIIVYEVSESNGSSYSPPHYLFINHYLHVRMRTRSKPSMWDYISVR